MSVLLMISLYICVACCFLDVDLPWSLWPGSVLCLSVRLGHEWSVDDQSVLLAAFLMLISHGGHGHYSVCLSGCPSV